MHAQSLTLEKWEHMHQICSIPLLDVRYMRRMPKIASTV